MSEIEHTPGPWKYGCRGSDTYWVGEDWNGEIVADIHRCHDNAEANARLITAAPDMSKALEDVKKQIQEIEDGDRPYTGFDTELLDAAIEKAKG